MTFATRFCLWYSMISESSIYHFTRLFIFSGVAGLIFLLKEVIKLANYGLELLKSAFDTGQKCCTFDVQNSAYNL